ncbi:MAG: magnesium transporter [Rickettsiales bacterium]
MNDLKKQNIEESLQYQQEAFEKLLANAIFVEDLKKAKKIIAEAHIADIADFIDKATSTQKEKTLKLIDEKLLSQIIVELDFSVIPIIIEMMEPRKVANIINIMDTDEAIYVLDSLDDNLREEIFKFLNKTKQKEITEGFSYPEDSAGRLMQKKFISVPEYWTVGQTIDFLRNQNNSIEVFYEIFVTNPKFVPVGAVPLSILISKPHELLISNIMTKEIKSLSTDLDDVEVSYLFKKYGFITMPVVNKNNRLVGVITLDDVFDVVDKKAEENIMHMSGLQEDDVYFNVVEIIKSRFPWLLVSLLATTICSIVVNLYHDTIQQVVILSAIMPIVAGISGNAGTQTMTVTILSLAGKELTSMNIMRVIRNQILSCTCNGLILAFLGGAILLLLHHDLSLSLIFGLAVTINFALAGLFGVVVPIVINKFDFDPAIASPVFVTTLTDVLSFAIFLGLATKLLI